MSLRLVTSPEQAIEGVRRFQSEMADSVEFQSYLAYFRAWYAVKEDGKWLLAPSKYIGYRNLSAADYLANLKEMNGRKTEDVLGPWFSEVTEGPLYDELWEALPDYLAQYGKAPCSVARISVLTGTAQAAAGATDDPQALASALLTLYRGLSDEAQHIVRQAIKKDL